MRNRKIILLLLLCLPMVGFSAVSSTNDSILRLLDQAVENRQEVIAQKEQKIREMKVDYRRATGLDKYDQCARICLIYNGFNTDSAFYYSKLCVALAGQLQSDSLLQQARIYQAECFGINCMFERARDILLPMSETVYPGNALLYYQACNSLCVWESEFTNIPEERSADRYKILSYRKKIAELTTDSITRVQEVAYLLAEDNLMKALHCVLPVFGTLPADDNNVRYLGNTIGSFYQRLEMPDSALYYYAVSAIADLNQGITEHSSLHQAAILLYRKGDVARAYRYMNCCIEDAQYCKARLRTVEMADDMPVVLTAYQRMLHRQNIRTALFVLAIVLIVILLIISLVHIVKSHTKLADSKQETKQKTEELGYTKEELGAAKERVKVRENELEDSNYIREQYVRQYIAECADLIGKFDAHQRELQKLAKQDNLQQLADAVRSTDFIEENARECYRHFDETFLSLFPLFVERVNTLFRADAQFAQPKNGRLSTELRILALFRLGIEDSDEMARFLRLTPKTIYNYRASIRNRAIDSRVVLDEQVRQIAL